MSSSGESNLPLEFCGLDFMNPFLDYLFHLLKGNEEMGLILILSA